MSSSAELKAIIDVIPADFADPEADYVAVRQMFAAFHGHPVADDLQIEIRELGGVRCGVYELADNPNHPTAFHCHGGGFVSTPLDEYHFYGEIIARQTGARVVMPDYRLAPEHPCPAAIDDCFEAYCALLHSGTDPAGVVMLGESCGGSIALALMLRLRDRQLPLPAAFVSLTGWFDLSVAGEPASGHDPFLTPAWVRNRGRDYTAGKIALDDPLVSPAYANLAGLPPMYLQVGQCDTVREGAITLASRALRAGVKVTLDSWPGAPQGWHGLVNAGVPEAQAAWAEIRRYIESL